jgi:hypothetical protein
VINMNGKPVNQPVAIAPPGFHVVRDPNGVLVCVQQVMTAEMQPELIERFAEIVAEKVIDKLDTREAIRKAKEAM